MHPDEAHGRELVREMISRVRHTVSDLPAPPFHIEGPHFRYDVAPDLFLGRTGTGPLHIAWDTNLLIDYFEYGSQLWSGDSLPDMLPGTYGEELEGLQLLVTMWVLRDIRFYIPRFFLQDTKRKALSAARQVQRRNAMIQFLQAITLVADAEGRDAPNPRAPHRTDECILTAVPSGMDRSLVRDAVLNGMDVFMTRDRGILEARDSVRLLGILVASPLDLVEELTAAGAFHCLVDPTSLTWPMPDQQRVLHLIRALQLNE